MAGVGATEPLMGQDRGCPQAAGQREPLCARDEPTVSLRGLWRDWILLGRIQSRTKPTT